MLLGTIVTVRTMMPSLSKNVRWHSPIVYDSGFTFGHGTGRSLSLDPAVVHGYIGQQDD